MSSSQISNLALPAGSKNGTLSKLVSQQQSLQSMRLEAQQLLAKVEHTQRMLNIYWNDKLDPFATIFPLEIVRHIFCDVVEYPTRVPDHAHDADDDNIWPTPVVIPVYGNRPITNAMDLACVCSHWREVVCALPELWTSVEADLTAPFGKQDLSLLHSVLSLSGTRLLQMSFSCRYPLLDYANCRMTKHWRKVFDTALVHSNRWVYLKLCLPPIIATSLREVLPPEPYHTRHNIKRIHAEIPTHVAYPSPTGTRLDLNWGSVTHLHLSAYVTFPMVAISWRSLTHLRTAEFEYQAIFFILAEAPLLTHLTIDNTPDDQDTGWLLPLTHENLKYLDISMLTAHEGRCVLHLARFPGLVEFKMFDYYSFSDSTSTVVEDIVPRAFMESLSSLQRFAWKSIISHNWCDQAIQLLRAVPTLKSLDIDFVETRMGTSTDHPSVDALLDALVAGAGNAPSNSAATGGSAVLLPHLQVLSLSGRFTVKWDNIRRVLAKDSPTSRPEFKALALDFRPSRGDVKPQATIDSSTLCWMKEYLDKGIALTVGKGPYPGSILKHVLRQVDTNAEGSLESSEGLSVY